MTEGLLTIAYGPQKYIKMAEALSLSYRRFGPTRPIAVVTDEENRHSMEQYFDIIILVRPDFGSGVVQKLHSDLYSPFEKTLFVDSDCLMYKDPEKLWNLYAHGDFSVRGWRYLTGYTEYEQQSKYDMVEDVPSFLRNNKITRLAHFNSGAFYFTKSLIAKNVFQEARSIYARRSTLGFVAFKNAPMADEPAFAVAMELCGIEMDPWDSENGMETAINIERISEINVLRPRARFFKSGVERNPALLHFNVYAQHSFVYGREMLRLRYEKHKFSPLFIVVSLSGWFASTIPERVKNRGISTAKQIRSYIATRFFKSA